MPGAQVSAPIPISLCDFELLPDRCRVVARPFSAGASFAPTDPLLRRVLALTEDEVVSALTSAYDRFAGRHADLDAVLEEHYQFVAGGVPELASLSDDRRRLIGAYYTQEFSIEAAALTNPSIVADPDQSGVDPGALRFNLSLRAIGEGHLSSIEFRSGCIDAKGTVTVEAPARYASTGSHRSVELDKSEFRSKLAEMGADDDETATVVDQLPARFELHHLESVIGTVAGSPKPGSTTDFANRAMHWLARSSYELVFPEASALSARVIFPWQPVESRGLEDARFVRFVDDDGSVTYYATYTAYDGVRVLPQLIQTPDFRQFRIGTLSGACAANKGTALFPRKIDGRYVALSRYDTENSYVMFSDNVQQWDTAQQIEAPIAPWALARVGNCGPPLETDAGWLVITHGVGPFRVYSLGAILLDLNDPRQVRGRLTEPLLAPSDADRDGYVPNVVYSCGSIIHGGELIVPYGTSDTSCRIARIDLDALLDRLTH
jgi:predicted GH43/DUF377 family glycosyl hydrolase